MCNNYEWYKGIKGDYVIPSMEFIQSEIHNARECLRERKEVAVPPGAYINILRCITFELHANKEVEMDEVS